MSVTCVVRVRLRGLGLCAWRAGSVWWEGRVACVMAPVPPGNSVFLGWSGKKEGERGVSITQRARTGTLGHTAGHSATWGKGGPLPYVITLNGAARRPRDQRREPSSAPNAPRKRSTSKAPGGSLSTSSESGSAGGLASGGALQGRLLPGDGGGKASGATEMGSAGEARYLSAEEERSPPTPPACCCRCCCGGAGGGAAGVGDA